MQNNSESDSKKGKLRLRGWCICPRPGGVCRWLILEVPGANLHFKTHIKNTVKTGARETVELEKRLPGKPKVLGSVPQNTGKKLSRPQCVSAGLGQAETA